MDDKNNNVYRYNVYEGPVKQEVMSEERKEYLEEKNRMLEKRNKRKKIISSVVIVSLVLVVGSFLFINYFRPVKIDERIDKNSIHYATDLYYSDGKYYEEYLSEKDKELYVDFLNSVKDKETKVKINCLDYGYDTKSSCSGSLYTIINVILMEHPDLFWYRTSSWSYYEGEEITLTHHLVSSNSLRLYFVEKRLLRKIDEVSKDIEKLDSEYDKVKAVYDWLGKNKEYSDIMLRKDGTAWSALLDNDTVCAGFAAASQLLFQRLGIESMLVTGNLDGSGHAWNFVKIDGEYYWYDATVGGSNQNNSYFYKGLLFSDTSRYSVDLVDLSKMKFGTKYIES